MSRQIGEDRAAPRLAFPVPPLGIKLSLGIVHTELSDSAWPQTVDLDSARLLTSTIMPSKINKFHLSHLTPTYTRSNQAGPSIADQTTPDPLFLCVQSHDPIIPCRSRSLLSSLHSHNRPPTDISAETLSGRLTPVTERVETSFVFIYSVSS